MGSLGLVRQLSVYITSFICGNFSLSQLFIISFVSNIDKNFYSIQEISSVFCFMASCIRCCRLPIHVQLLKNRTVAVLLFQI